MMRKTLKPKQMMITGIRNPHIYIAKTKKQKPNRKSPSVRVWKRRQWRAGERVKAEQRTKIVEMRFPASKLHNLQNKTPALIIGLSRPA
ncbi:hypothetical protein U1Q18_042154 [Sarracenia purpurea var. burkii]